LPTREEWDELAGAVGGWEERCHFGRYHDWWEAGTYLKSKDGWIWNNDENISGNGTDDYGFSALPGGFRGTDGSFLYA
jgi:uncharacterized protein (TIGR02145 family)